MCIQKIGNCILASVLDTLKFTLWYFSLVGIVEHLNFVLSIIDSLAVSLHINCHPELTHEIVCLHGGWLSEKGLIPLISDGIPHQESGVVLSSTVSVH